MTLFDIVRSYTNSINKEKQMIVQLFSKIFDDVKLFQDTYIVMRNDKYGILSRADGSFIVPMEYDTLIPVSEKLIIAEKDGKFGVIDFNHSAILPFEYDSIRLIETKRLFFFKEAKLLTKKGDIYKTYKLKELEKATNYDKEF